MSATTRQMMAAYGKLTATSQKRVRTIAMSSLDEHVTPENHERLLSAFELIARTELTPTEAEDEFQFVCTWLVDARTTLRFIEQFEN